MEIVVGAELRDEPACEIVVDSRPDEGREGIPLENLGGVEGIVRDLGRDFVGASIGRGTIADVGNAIGVAVRPEVDRGVGVDDPPAVVVVRPVGLGRTPAAWGDVGSRIDQNGSGGLLDVAPCDRDVMAEDRLRRPEKRDRSHIVRARHRGAAEGRVRVSDDRRANRASRTRDVRLQSVAPVDRDGSDAAVVREAVGRAELGQRARREDGVVEGRRIRDRRTLRARIAGRRDHHLPCRVDRLDGRLESERRASFGAGATPGVVRDVGAEVGAPIGHRIGTLGVRSEGPLHALRVPGGCSVALFHVSAGDPARSRRHANLVAPAVVSDHGSRRVSPMIIVVEGNGRVIDGVVPGVGVVGHLAVPTTVFRLDRRVCPVDPRIARGDDDPLPPDPLRPDIGGMNRAHTPLDGLRCFGRIDRRVSGRDPCRRDRFEVPVSLEPSLIRVYKAMNQGVRLDPDRVRARCQFPGETEIPFHEHRVDDPVPGVLDTSGLEPVDQGALRSRCILP